MKRSPGNPGRFNLSKSVFEVAVSPIPGRVDERRRLSRRKFLEFFANRPPATVVMEACGTAHHWARKLTELGHAPTLLPPAQVRAYVPRNKTDRTDTKALLEAVRNEDIRAVPVKTVDQQTIAALHRARSAWLADRTARTNLVRSVLREFGIEIATGARRVVPSAWAAIEDAEQALTAPVRAMVAAACDEIRSLEERVTVIDRQLEEVCSTNDTVKRLRSVPGIGPLTGTALVGFVGDARRFSSGRRLASYLGLTPREHSSGQRRWLGGISKRGDRYLRMLLIHGARSVVYWSARATSPSAFQRWVCELRE